jgi:hypothetical protein
VSRFAGHRQVVGSGAAGLVGAAGQAAMTRPVMSAQIRTAWAVVEALVLTMLDPGHDLPLGRAIALQLVGDHSPHYQIDRLLPSKLIHLMVPSAHPLESVVSQYGDMSHSIRKGNPFNNTTPRSGIVHACRMPGSRI